ncbi:MAG TPA: Crp/Fnr family transcriptional regulator [Pseudosphingobacterium sp.]|nr:Crp/Fnr family transcriptional regulator [Pseudosphingobacterium sp.]
MTNIPDILDKHFGHFEPDLKELLLQKCHTQSYQAGDFMMKPGQYFKFAMLILKGRVKLYRESDEGTEFFMYYLIPGNACALSIICATKQQQSEVLAKAVNHTTVLMIPIAMMDDLMRKYKSWYYFVLETYRARFEELLVVIDHIAFKGMDERLEFYLKKQVDDLETRKLNITHQEIASDLSTSREVISRLLKKMEQQHYIKLYRSHIEWLK